MKDLDRLARRAAGGDVSAARRLLAILEGRGAEDPIKEALEEFVGDIESTGGVMLSRTGKPRPEADPEWTDLGETYLKACKALGREPDVIRPPVPLGRSSSLPAIHGGMASSVGEPGSGLALQGGQSTSTPDDGPVARCATCDKPINFENGIPCGVCGAAYCFECYGDAQSEACEGCVEVEERMGDESTPSGEFDS